MKYDAFISYHQNPDRQLSESLQLGLRKLGSKWYKLKFRVLEIFRDETDSAGFDSLKQKILDGIDKSDYMILLASATGIAASKGKMNWVAEEVDYWLKTKPPKVGQDGRIIGPKIILCITDGEIAWDYTPNSMDFDWNITNCLPSSLKSKFIEAPYWVDLRKFRNYQTKSLSLNSPEFKKGVANISSQIQGINADKLIAKDSQYKLIGRSILVFIVLSFFTLLFITAQKTIETARERKTSQLQRDKRLLDSLEAEAIDIIESGYGPRDMTFSKYVNKVRSNSKIFLVELAKRIKPSDERPECCGKSAVVRWKNQHALYDGLVKGTATGIPSAPK